ncbi:MAG TPA: S-methyl-5'-thioadenosine phosphorylase [Chloroflexia bacterium]|nr:S-methyl-5'-thioadenosine phosphorylase [Chloroflexia bacterium]
MSGAEEAHAARPAGEAPRIGIIGGSGFYNMPGLTGVEEVRVDTPFGPPSDAIILGTLAGRRVAFLPRHGRGHVISPSELPVQANIWALKSLGVQRLLSISAVGSMLEGIAPSDLVVPDQLIDRTVSRPRTFFGEGLVGHVALADPYCPQLRSALVASGHAAGAPIHDGGTYIVIEGPQFSTRAESRLFRSWGVAVIGMTAMPEARLAREAELCYANLALATDYDSWHDVHESVTADLVMQNLARSVQAAQATVTGLVATLVDQAAAGCQCAHALDGAIMTAPDKIPPTVRERLGPILGRVLTTHP